LRSSPRADRRHHWGTFIRAATTWRPRQPLFPDARPLAPRPHTTPRGVPHRRYDPAAPAADRRCATDHAPRTPRCAAACPTRRRLHVTPSAWSVLPSTDSPLRRLPPPRERHRPPGHPPAPRLLRLPPQPAAPTHPDRALNASPAGPRPP